MKKILIANRGEVAVRIIRACRELNIATVAIHSTADKDSLHAKLADESICIGPAQAHKSYLHIPAILSAAEMTGAQGVHPGYGFLSENYQFARICEESNLKFIGPTKDQIKHLGSKVEARSLAIKAKVPLLPGSDGVVGSLEEAEDLADKIGYPVIIKASAGGGGKGMKIVRAKKDLELQFKLAQKEALQGFGCSDCFIEKYLESPKHIEVQIVADQHGNLLHLGERDCSIQRRHQKIIEEAPSPILDKKHQKEVGQYALSLAHEINYQSLGTVEFLYDQGKFYFMEMNTRLQVEHPVTELVFGTDLVKQQILIAMNEKLTTQPLEARGHSIECRINAEDPENFIPQPGRISEYHQPGGPGIRIDSALYSGYTVPSFYDSLIAKLISFGQNRQEAITRMSRALKETKIEGIKTNIPLLEKIMGDHEFQEGHFSTSYLQKFIDKA